MTVKGNDQEADEEERFNQFILELQPLMGELMNYTSPNLIELG